MSKSVQEVFSRKQISQIAIAYSQGNYTHFDFLQQILLKKQKKIALTGNTFLVLRVEFLTVGNGELKLQETSSFLKKRPKA